MLLIDILLAVTPGAKVPIDGGLLFMTIAGGGYAYMKIRGKDTPKF